MWPDDDGPGQGYLNDVLAELARLAPRPTVHRGAKRGENERVSADLGRQVKGDGQNPEMAEKGRSGGEKATSEGYEGTTPERIRTSNLRFRRPMLTNRNHIISQQVTESTPKAGAPTGAVSAEDDPHLQLVIERWRSLPPDVKRTILALVGGGATDES